MTGPVVVGVDDFEHSDHLIATAAREARLRGTTLLLAHAYQGYAPVSQGVPPGFTPEQILQDVTEEQLAGLAAELKTDHFDLHVETTAVAGPAAPALARLAGQASLLVVGGRGRGGLAGQLLGSVSLGVLGHAPCPVLVVRGEGARTTGRVMVGIDIDDPATGPQVLEFACAEATARGADLYAFHAWEDPSSLYAFGSQIYARDQRAAALKRGREGLARALAPFQEKYPQLRTTTEVLTGPPAKLLVEATELADLVVIGGRPRDGRAGMRVGAIAHTVLHHAHCPVAVVPEG